MEPQSTIIDVDTTDALEMGPAEKGEYRLLILKAELKSGEGSQGPWKGIALTMDLPDVLTADIFNSMVWLPDEDSQEAKRFETTKTAFDKFKRACGFGAADTFTLEELIGKEPWAYITIKSDPEYGDQNRVSSWITGPSAQAGPEY